VSYLAIKNTVTVLVHRNYIYIYIDLLIYGPNDGLCRLAQGLEAKKEPQPPLSLYELGGGGAS
jgi:hypothetical protein